MDGIFLDYCEPHIAQSPSGLVYLFKQMSYVTGLEADKTPNVRQASIAFAYCYRLLRSRFGESA